MNRRFQHLASAAAIGIALVTAGSGAVAGPSPESPQGATPRPAPSGHLGRVVGIDPIRTRPQGSGVGAVAGGVVGGLIGNKVIGGTAATAIGAVGGAVAGNNLERNHREGVAGYHVHLRMDNGVSRTIDQSHIGNLHVGDRVRLDGTRIRRL